MSIRVKFNINDRMTVTLTDTGKQIILAERAETGLDNLYAWDSENRLTSQGWVIMQLFGEHIGMGLNNPFEMTVELHECGVILK